MLAHLKILNIFSIFSLLIFICPFYQVLPRYWETIGRIYNVPRIMRLMNIAIECLGIAMFIIVCLYFFSLDQDSTWCGVYNFVLTHVSFALERFATLIAGKWPFLCMDYLVFWKVTPPFKWHGTLFAKERFHVSMRQTVFFEVARCGKWHITHNTLKCFFPSVTLFMAPQTLHNTKRFVANVAIEWFFLGMSCLVTFKVFCSFERLGAFLTREWADTCVCFLVIPKLA